MEILEKMLKMCKVLESKRIKNHGELTNLQVNCHHLHFAVTVSSIGGFVNWFCSPVGCSSTDKPYIRWTSLHLWNTREVFWPHRVHKQRSPSVKEIFKAALNPETASKEGVEGDSQRLGAQDNYHFQGEHAFLPNFFLTNLRWSQSVPTFLEILESSSLITNPYFSLRPLQPVGFCFIFRRRRMRGSKIDGQTLGMQHSVLLWQSHPLPYGAIWLHGPHFLPLKKTFYPTSSRESVAS